MSRHAGDEKRLQELIAERERLTEEIREAEKAAGILEQGDEAREGPLIPYGVFDKVPSDPKQKSLEDDLYWADQHDHIRQEIRALYFAIPDTTARKKLMLAVAEREKARKRIVAQLVVNADLELTAMKRKQANPPWIGAGVIGCLAVLVGYAVAGIAGAIAGGILGYFWGKGMVSSAGTDAEAAVKIAAGALHDAEADSREVAAKDAWQPAYFSESEMRSAIEDKEFGKLSATGKRLALERG